MNVRLQKGEDLEGWDVIEEWGQEVVVDFVAHMGRVVLKEGMVPRAIVALNRNEYPMPLRLIQGNSKS